MSLLQGTRRALLRGGKTYRDKVLSYGPTGYWVQGEAPVAPLPPAVDQVNSPAQDGTYIGVTLGQPGIGDGNTCPLFDGVADYNNILTAAIQAAFNGQEGSFFAWVRVNAPGVWIDGATRRVVNAVVDANNRIYLLKNNANNTMSYRIVAGGVSQLHNQNPISSTDWMHVGMTWSRTTNQFIPYYNGDPLVTMAGVGLWAGAVFSEFLIGTGTVAPVDLWNGVIAHPAFWDRAIARAVVEDLAVL